MAFWDHISQKASETTGKAVQKAKDLSDVARLNAAISEEENKIRELYYQIGKLYSAMHMQDAEPAFADLVAAVAEANNKIVCCKQQILDIKGVISCPRCGAEVAVGSAFCSACGSPIAGNRTPEQEGMVHCEHCGALIKKGVRFCTQCGNPVTQTAAETLPAAEAKELKICPNCGAELESDAAFCTECGTKM